MRCDIIDVSCLRPIAGRSSRSQVSTARAALGLPVGLEDLYRGYIVREDRRTRNSPVAMVETGVPLDDEQLRELVDRRGACWTAFEMPVSCTELCAWCETASCSLESSRVIV